MKLTKMVGAVTAWICLSVVTLAIADETPDWVKSLREGEVPGKAFPRESADQWMKANLIPGETTKAEVFELLGDPAKQKTKIPRGAHDLDRPERDQVESIQYVLWYGDRVNWGALNIDFDRDSGKLVNFGIGSCVCGFCPHVLAHDGDRWRLEGKMLAGCVGAENEGNDLLVLPRLKVSTEGIARVRLANWAPEVEELREPRLFAVALLPGEELDAGIDGKPVVWRPIREFYSESVKPMGGGLDGHPNADVLVLELKNTSALERYLRGVFLDDAPDNLGTSLTVDFGTVGSAEVRAVGTKFLRRVVVPIPDGATAVDFHGHDEFWFSRRAWLGQRESVDGRSAWTSPTESAAQSLRLNPLDTENLSFPVSLEGKLGFALQLSGFYCFDETAIRSAGR